MTWIRLCLQGQASPMLVVVSVIASAGCGQDNGKNKGPGSLPDRNSIAAIEALDKIRCSRDGIELLHAMRAFRRCGEPGRRSAQSWLSDKDRERVISSLYAFASLGGPDSVRQISAFLASQDVLLREKAMDALTYCPCKESLAALIGVLSPNDDFPICWLSIDATLAMVRFRQLVGDDGVDRPEPPDVVGPKDSWPELVRLFKEWWAVHRNQAWDGVRQSYEHWFSDMMDREKTKDQENF